MREERLAPNPAPVADGIGMRSSVVAPSVLARLRAHVFSYRYDCELEAGVDPEPGSALQVHGARLSSDTERADLAHALRVVLYDAETGTSLRHGRVPIRSDAVRRAADLIEGVIDRLESPSPARVRGVARLRILLADGQGPLYRSDRGSVTAAMRGVLAAL
ncbi:hypothetical protein [Mycolicibacterium lacusdiani]|uniref:hypothetical protein n=1 Tax=Mycolicibacterium lacusdiani TaxID=2895283 RepID=UPI001F4256D1|nr:hypothetical protein [Mycolicibacterium lacusdiani]